MKQDLCVQQDEGGQANPASCVLCWSLATDFRHISAWNFFLLKAHFPPKQQLQEMLSICSKVIWCWKGKAQVEAVMNLVRAGFLMQWGFSQISCNRVITIQLCRQTGYPWNLSCSQEAKETRWILLIKSTWSIYSQDFQEWGGLEAFCSAWDIS